MHVLFFFSSRRRHTRFDCDWSSDVCSSDLRNRPAEGGGASRGGSSSWGTQYRESGAWDAPPGKDNGLYTPSKSPDRKSTRLNSSHSQISYAVFCLKKKNTIPVNDVSLIHTI